MKLTEFFKNDYSQFAVYDNQRKIASIVDGLKISQRKVIHTLLKNPNMESRVDALANRVSADTSYLHGSVSLEGVIVNLAVDYVGSNNVPFIQGEGHFGTRTNNRPSASRYIYAKIHNNTSEYFTKDDLDFIKPQVFEGVEIEPKTFMPVLPVLLINGAEGVSVGFSQKILGRKVSNVKKLVKALLTDGTIRKDWLLPHFNGFNGTVEFNDNGGYTIKGVIEKVNNNTLRITEIPVGIELNKFITKLETLYEKKIITDYKDKSTDESFEFEIKATRAFTKKSENTLLKTLGLVQNVSEVITVIDENGKTTVYDDIVSLARQWVDLRVSFIKERTVYQIDKITTKISESESVTQILEYIQSNITTYVNTSDEEFITMTKKSCDKFTQKSYDKVSSMKLSSIKLASSEKLKGAIKKDYEELSRLKSLVTKDVMLNEIMSIKD